MTLAGLQEFTSEDVLSLKPIRAVTLNGLDAFLANVPPFKVVALAFGKSEGQVRARVTGEGEGLGESAGQVPQRAAPSEGFKVVALTFGKSKGQVRYKVRGRVEGR